MTAAQRAIAKRLHAQGLSPYKIALSLGMHAYAVAYFLDHGGERAKMAARLRRWRARLRVAA